MLSVLEVTQRVPPTCITNTNFTYLFAAAVHAESFQIHRAFGGVIFEHRVKGFAFNVQVFVDGGGRGRSTENEGRSGFK